MTTLEHKHCLPCAGMGTPLDASTVQNHLQNIASDWQAAPDVQSIFKDFKFKNYYQTIAFVNTIAWMTHLENHHPDLEVGYNHCLVRYSTHAIGGLSQNDFICAAKIDKLFQPYAEKFYDRK
jgi:4a-hydroxytetrahydrobiopterin dehydratase